MAARPAWILSLAIAAALAAGGPAAGASGPAIPRSTTRSTGSPRPGAALSSAAAFRHPWHTSLAQAEYDERTGSLEVALRVDALDLEDALSRLAGKRIDLDRAADADLRIAAYLRGRFVVRDANGARVKLSWVGKEVFVTNAWLYFEAPLPDGPSGIRITDRLFFETQQRQVNSIHCRHGQRQATLIYRADSPAQAWPL